MDLGKLIDEFADEYIKNGTYADREAIVFFAKKMADIIKSNKDATPEEIINIIIQDEINLLEDTRKKYGTPGYTASINVDNINIKLYGGNINYLGDPMPSDALFDVASMTKFYTQIIIANLIKEGLFSFDDVISRLDNRFKNLGDITVYDVTSFTTSFKTPGRIDDKRTVEEAKDAVYRSEVIEKGKYNYNDIGMIIMKEFMESQTGLTYNQLVEKYILAPLGLKDTHLIVPLSKYKLLTGSPVINAKQGLVNDTKAIALGGFSGHAGMWSSSDDLIKLMREVSKNDVVPNISQAYTSGVNNARGIMGNTFTTHPKGLKGSYLDIKEPINSFGIQGSTRVNAIGNKTSADTVLFNPASMSVEQALEKQTMFNEKEKAKGKKIQNFVKQFEFDRNGKLLDVYLIDARQIFSVVNVERVIAKNSELKVMIGFFNKVLKEYYNYDKDINISKNNSR